MRDTAANTHIKIARRFHTLQRTQQFADLFKQAQDIGQGSGAIVEMLFLAAAWYLVLTSIGLSHSGAGVASFVLMGDTIGALWKHSCHSQASPFPLARTAAGAPSAATISVADGRSETIRTLLARERKQDEGGEHEAHAGDVPSRVAVEIPHHAAEERQRFRRGP